MEKESNDICCQLTKIWEQYKEEFKPDNKILERGFVFSKSEKSDIVFIGINPYCKENADVECEKYGFSFPDAVANKKKEDKYFINLYKLIRDNPPEFKIDYLDLFYFRGEQTVFKYFHKEPSGGPFLAEQLAITQRQLEKIKPKLIIVFNRAAREYFGKDETKVWMGYDLHPIKINGLENNEDFQVIKGLVNSDGRVAKDITKTNLEGTIVYFSKYLGRAKKETKGQISENITLIINHIKNETH